MKAASGAMTMSGTAHPSVVAGSNVKPAGGRDPDALPEAAVARFAATATSRLSETSPDRRFLRQA
jgi:hypothetical protein